MLLSKEFNPLVARKFLPYIHGLSKTQQVTLRPTADVAKVLYMSISTRGRIGEEDVQGNVGI